MKLKQMTLVSALAIIALAACNKDEKIDTSKGYGDNPVTFASNIVAPEARATDTQWDSNDAVGVFMVRKGSTINMSNDLPAKNKKYITKDGSGRFAAAAETDQVVLPADGSTMDFIAYYPYTTKWTGNLIDINVADQSQPAAIDLLYSTNLKGVSAATPQEQIKLEFGHQLSKVVFKLKSADGKKLSNPTLTLKGFNTIGHFNISNGTVTPTESAKPITAKISNNTASAILIPGKATEPSLHISASGKTYTYKLPSNTELKKGTKITFEATMYPDGTITLVEPNGTITDWTNEDGGNIDLNPDEETPTLSLSTENLSFESSASTQEVSITTSTGQDWTATPSDQSWLTVAPAAGKGSAKLTISATANTSKARTAQITVTAGSISKTIAVSQAAGSDPTPGVVVEFFKEAFSKLGATGTQVNNFETGYKEYVDHPELSYSVSYAKGMLRSTKSIDGHIWFGSKYDNWFKMEGIDISKHKDIVLTYDVAANGTDDLLSALTVKANGVAVEVPETANAGQNNYGTIAIPLKNVTGTTLSLVFAASGLKNGLRLDNIILKGIKK